MRNWYVSYLWGRCRVEGLLLGAKSWLPGSCLKGSRNCSASEFRFSSFFHRTRCPWTLLCAKATAFSKNKPHWVTGKKRERERRKHLSRKHCVWHHGDKAACPADTSSELTFHKRKNTKLFLDLANLVQERAASSVITTFRQVSIYNMVFFFFFF